MPRAPGGCQRGRVFVKTSCESVSTSTEDIQSRQKFLLTGPMSNTGVSSRTFSIGALEASSGGGSKRVTLFAMVSQ